MYLVINTLMSTIAIECDRLDRIYHPLETVKGNVIINATNPFSFSNIILRVSGIVKLQLSAKSVGLFAAYVNSTDPVDLISIEEPICHASKVKIGINKFPFEFKLQATDEFKVRLHRIY